MIMTFISSTTKAFFYWSPFTPLVVTSKNRFSMITNCQQLKLKRDCRVANATSRLQQTHFQPCAGITCAGSRRTNEQPSPVQVDNRSPPVLNWSARYDCQTYLTLFFLFEQKMALTISYLEWNWRLMCITFKCTLKINHIFSFTRLVIFNSIYTHKRKMF